MPGWKGSTRRRRLPKNWPNLRRATFERDGHQCTERLELDGSRCPAPAEHCDHVIPGDDHRLENLTSLCAYHHGQKSAREGQAARPKHTLRRPAEAHPGLLP